MILGATVDNIDYCAGLLQQDEIIGIPTETVYGLAGNALKESSVRKIFQVKGRPLMDPLIVHCNHPEAAEQIAKLNDPARKLAKTFWPGPLTMVVTKDQSIPDIVTAGLNSVAVRVPQHPVFRSVLERIDFPLAAPSANPFGYVSPTLAEHVQHTLGSKIKAILDGGPCKIGIESTIVDLRDPQMPTILRYGPINSLQISNCLGFSVKTAIPEKNNDTAAQSAPGQLTRHYSPRTKVDLLEHGCTQNKNPIVSHCDKTIALVCNKKPKWYTGQPNIYWLSETGNPDEIAYNLFNLIQKLDRQQFEKICIEQVSPETIGSAINDRLRRAAARKS
jgi:L-threonylcarbamoyladenylate synthase